MNIRKFWKKISNNPWLIGCVGTPFIASSHLNQTRGAWVISMSEWAKKHISFIADRPWNTLSLKDGSSTFRDGNLSISTVYEIRLHIVGNENPFTRVRWVNHREETREENTIEDTLRHLTSWHQGYWAKQDRALSIDAILKTTTHFIEGVGVQSQSIEIFRPPSNFQIT
jgi:hypothetical protein